MKESSETKERIVKVAMELFYRNGYSETGINEILEKSSSFKKSLYTHFSSKTELGITYIRWIEKDLLEMSQKVMTKYPKYEDFIRSWIRIIKNRTFKYFSNGCPLANMPLNTPEIQKEVKIVFQNLKDPFINYFMTNYKIPRSRSIEISEEILFLYEGAVTSFKLDPNKRYFEYLEKHLDSISREL
jgi:AcrR family transcriptional regulator